MRQPICALFVGLVVVSSIGRAAETTPALGLNKKVAVTKDTRLDWTFVVSNQSLTKPLDQWKMGDYDSTKQHYDLFVPPGIEKDKSYPLIVFISAGGEPVGFDQCAALCKDSKVFFASPYNAGNGPSLPRIRIVLDVLDDVRRQVQDRPGPYLYRRPLRRRPGRAGNSFCLARGFRRRLAGGRCRGTAQQAVAASARGRPHERGVDHG